MLNPEAAFQKCIFPSCGATYDVGEILVACPKCGSLLDVAYDWDKTRPPASLAEFEQKWARRNDPNALSGVWRFHELLPFVRPESIVTIGEGQTVLQRSDSAARYAGLALDRMYLQYEGLNPSGSFKDNGMTAAFTHGHMLGSKRAACASTGNTSASLAIYCSSTQKMQAVIFIGSGKIAYGKLSQALDYGALTVQIEGDFDDAMARVKEVSREMGIYLVNSVNPFRLEGQKTIMYRVLEALRWSTPDWIVVPGGNLGNSSAFAKAFLELKELGLIDRIPRLAIINATGANTLYELHENRGLRWNGGSPDKEIVNKYYSELDAGHAKASTIASAIEINRPVNLYKCIRALEICDGVVREVSDADILDAKAQVGRGGFGCEPASAASLAGARGLVHEGIIAPDERVVCILTGHLLKDPTATVAYHGTDSEKIRQIMSGADPAYANQAITVANDTRSIVEVLQSHGKPVASV